MLTIQLKWLLVALATIAWLWPCRDDLKSGGYGTGFGVVMATLAYAVFWIIWLLIYY